MGYVVTRFTHAIDEEFHCSICSMVLKDPVQSPCEHLFCNDCIRGWLAVDESCPVEHGPLKLEDVKPAPRAVRNFVNKFEIKCDFESKSCGEILKLENLQDHVSRCEYSKVICDNGCNIEISRHEYETKNCFRHLADQAVRQQETILKLNNRVSLQDEKIEKLSEEVTSLRTQRPDFRVLYGNGKISIDQNVLEVDNGCGYAQSIKPLEPTKFSFKFETLSLGIYFWVGLAGDAHQFTLYCRSDGWSNFKGKIEKLGPAWKVGDIIECGINFPSDFVNDGRDVRFYINQNDKLMGEELVAMPINGFFPTVYMYGGSKIKYLSD